MKLGALFSGGKDSTFAIYNEIKNGNKIEALISLFPKSEESHLLHFPELEITKLQSKSLGIPQILEKCESNETDEELLILEQMLNKAKKEFGIEGLVHGGILSDFQRQSFKKICDNQNLKLISPLWEKDQEEYMKNLIDADFHFIIISVSSAGLDDSWLGKEIGKKELEQLDKLSKIHEFNLTFEGGEAETLVLGCPLFTKKISITQSKKIWDGYRGNLKIKKAILSKKND